MIRQVTLSDADDIRLIYNDYVLNTVFTFEESALTTDVMCIRIENIIQNYPWLVYEDKEQVIGYTYASRWRERPAYRYSVEAGIYIDRNYIGIGIGSKLMESLQNELRKISVHSIMCGIALPNPASIALCEKFKFQKVAHFKEVGFKLNRWIDVGYWERIL